MKKISDSYFITILDRLTRFKPANVRFKRVFDDIINKFSSADKQKNMTFDEELELACQIINSSVTSDNNDEYIKELFFEIENKYFAYNEISQKYLSLKLNLFNMFSKINFNQKLPKNVLWLKYAIDNKISLCDLREKNSLLYPVEKIVLCEGQTEYTLLETVFKLFDYDFNKNGIFVIPAGGKNQVARMYYSMIEYTKLPFFILLDNDALSINEIINTKLRLIDKVYLLKSGEFEDLIPQQIIVNTINCFHKNYENCNVNDISPYVSNVKNIELIYKKYGYGEFKKALFAQELNEYIINNCSKDDFINSEIPNMIRIFLS